MTNGDRIRAMSDEELAKFLRTIMNCLSCPVQKTCFLEVGCMTKIARWLKQEAKDE